MKPLLDQTIFYHVAQIIFSWHLDVQTDNDVVDANDILDQIHHR